MKGIEYLDKTWNPISMRCTPCSPGCEHCWHLVMAKRLAKYPKVSNQDRLGYSGGPFHLNKLKLEYPMHWYKPARIGVQFMGDWMHPNVPIEWIDQIIDVIGNCPQHTFFTLTKRPENLINILKVNYEVRSPKDIRDIPFPYFDNLWLGVTVCNQDEADSEIPDLLRLPGFKKWVSVEPMLGPIILHDPETDGFGNPLEITILNALDFVVAGAETGPGARPAHPDWFRSIREQCQAAGVPFFFKGFNPVGGPRSFSRILDGKEWNETPYLKRFPNDQT